MRRHLEHGLLLLGGLAASVYVALSAASLGDYPGDGGPALNALLHGDLQGFSHAKPAMGVLSLVLRLPFAGLAYLGSPTPQSIYRWGAVPCVASVALLGVWLARIAGRRGTRMAGQAAIVALAIFNPLVQSALALGHPEELLTASLAVAAIVAAVEQRLSVAVVLLGLALASKQWAVLAVLPVLVALDSNRLRALAGSVAIAAAVSLPAVVGSPGTFLANHLALVHEHYLEPGVYSWLFPLAPRVTVHLAGGLVHRGPLLPATLVGLLHPLIIGVAVLVAARLARLERTQLTGERILAGVALIFLLRCTLDTETMPYYHAPLFAVLLAWDALHGERLPLRAGAAAGVSYALFDRLTPDVIGTSATTWLYAAATLTVALLLTRTLSSRQRHYSKSTSAGLPLRRAARTRSAIRSLVYPTSS